MENETMRTSRGVVATTDRIAKRIAIWGNAILVLVAVWAIFSKYVIGYWQIVHPLFWLGYAGVMWILALQRKWLIAIPAFAYISILDLPTFRGRK